MEKTLGASLAKVFGVDLDRYTKSMVEKQQNAEKENDSSSLNNATEQIDSGLKNQSLSELIQKAVKVFERSQTQQREGDWAGYGGMNELQSILQQLDAVQLPTNVNSDESSSEDLNKSPTEMKTPNKRCYNLITLDLRYNCGE